jgi:hypothetical protein
MTGHTDESSCGVFVVYFQHWEWGCGYIYSCGSRRRWIHNWSLRYFDGVFRMVLVIVLAFNARETMSVRR